MKLAALAAAVVAAPLALGFAAAPAEAKTNLDFSIYFGTPYYNYSPGAGYYFRPGYGWYMPRYGHYYGPRYARMSCAQAERWVERRGYDVTSRRDCVAPTYAFNAKIKKTGKRVVVYVNARTGRIWR